MKTLQEQYDGIKQQYPDALLLFRCGDFYEAYNEDADEASKILNVTLTKREDGRHLCGFPYHALDAYLPKLVRAGKRVAICDQLEDPKLEKNLVKRGVTELVSAGQETASAPKTEQETEELKQTVEQPKQLTLFEREPSDYILHYRDEVAKAILMNNFRSCIAEEAAQAANTLVYRLYGIKLQTYKGQPL